MLDIKKIKEVELSRKDLTEYSKVLSTWRQTIDWLNQEKDQEAIFKGLAYELRYSCRPSFIDRLRTKFNKLRNLDELRYLESLTDKTISIYYV